MNINQTIDELIKSGNPRSQWLEIGQIKPSKTNPRKIGKAEREGLKKSILKFPQMLDLRPGVIDENNVLLAGNQRYHCCVELGLKFFPVISAANLTEEQKKEFIIKDNLHAGQWDFDILESDWKPELLQDFGLTWEPEEDHEPVKPKAGNLKHIKQLRLKFSEPQYKKVIKALEKIAETPEEAILKLITLKQ